MSQLTTFDLSAEDITTLQAFANSGKRMLMRRAKIVLMSANNIPQIDIAAEIGLSERQVRRWQRSFEAEGMAIFPSDDMPQTESVIPTPQVEEEPVPDFSSGAPTNTEGLLSIDEATSAAPVIIPPPPEKEPIPGIDVPRRALTLTKKPGILADDAMAEAGRKVLFYQFERMLKHEPGSRTGEGIDSVHDMRVATRRMRSAFAIFLPYYRRKAVKPFIQGLRETARVLGTVRDLDVFLHKLNAYQQAHAGDGVGPLTDTIEAMQTKARQRFIKHVDSDAYAMFVAKFGDFLTTQSKDGWTTSQQTKSALDPKAYQVRHIVPHLIYARYEAVRAYETVLDHASIETLHSLRIECKKLRYTLEFFSETLGPKAKRVINEVKLLQDHLGDLNDAEVAGNMLRTFVIEYDAGQVNVPINERQNIEQIVNYMAFQFAEKHRLTTTFPEVWAQFNRYEVRQDLALAVAKL